VQGVVISSMNCNFVLISLSQLLKKDEHGNHNKQALNSCKQIVNCLVENVLRLEETSVGK